MKVAVYWNLHKNLWSIKSLETGRVITHTGYVQLADCTFKVSQAGRQRVLREKRKNVHAMVVGELTNAGPKLSEEFVSIYYNPYKVSTFVERESQAPVHAADTVIMNSERQVYALGAH